MSSYQDKKKAECLARMNWVTAPFTKDNIPEGRWGTNSIGNDYLACTDGSYYYFNKDEGQYFRDAASQDPTDAPLSVYRAPSGEVYYTPTSIEPGRFFSGENWRTRSVRAYWENAQGVVSLTAKRNLEEVEGGVEECFVATWANREGTERVVRVSREGVYEGTVREIVVELEGMVDSRMRELPATLLRKDRRFVPEVIKVELPPTPPESHPQPVPLPVANRGLVEQQRQPPSPPQTQTQPELSPRKRMRSPEAEEENSQSQTAGEAETPSPSKRMRALNFYDANDEEEVPGSPSPLRRRNGVAAEVVEDDGDDEVDQIVPLKFEEGIMRLLNLKWWRKIQRGGYFLGCRRGLIVEGFQECE